ncbi:MAG: MlaD family protein [Pseudomonadota bacterium]
MTDHDIPQVPKRDSGARNPLRGASFVWLVPIAAVVVALVVAINTYRDRGPLIRISFEDASGILPEETELRFRDVVVGLVENVAFNDDLTRVLVDVRVDQNVAPFIDGDAAFWVVQPEVTTSGVTGLETVLSGVYIEGTWDTERGDLVTEFIGLEQAPLLRAYRQGVVIELRSTRPSGLAENTPITFKGIEVGRLGPARISRDGRSVFANAIIFEPHDRLVSTATRFWDASGFSLSIGPNGAALDFSSLASLIAGGITFDTLVSGGEPVRSGLVYEVFPDEASARSSIFEENDGSTVTLSMLFNENVSGLVAEAPVEWRGIRLGQVVNVTGIVDQERFGDGRVRLLATIEIAPSRLGLGGQISQDEAIDFLSERVEQGLRARLASASILTGGLKVEFITDPTLPAAELQRDAVPFPVFPITESAVSDVSATAEGVFNRFNQLDIEGLLDSAIAFLNGATALVSSPDLQETPGEIRGLLSDARGVIGSEEVQALPGELTQLVSDLQSASADLRAIFQELREAGAVERLLAALDEVGLAAEAANAALQGVPSLLEEVEAFVAVARELPVDAFLDEATGLASEARILASSDALQALPATAGTAVENLAELLASLTEADTAGALDAALTEAADAASAVEAAVAGVPQLVTRIDTIAANAEAVRLDQLAAELEAILASASQLFNDTSDADLPTALSGALGEAQAAIAELRQGGLIDSANETMASARDAAAAIEDAADDLPILVDRLNATLGQAQATLSEYDGDSTFARQTSSALREIERAAEALTSLARTIERNPNSIILGR